jgi:hypothetical protein
VAGHCIKQLYRGTGEPEVCIEGVHWVSVAYLGIEIARAVPCQDASSNSSSCPRRPAALGRAGQPESGGSSRGA